MNEDNPWKPPIAGDSPERPEPEAPFLPPAGTGAPSPWSPEGADAWTSPPEPAAAPAPPPPPAPPGAPPWAQADPASPPVPPAPTGVVTAGEPPRRRRSKAVVGGAVAAVAALGLAGLFAVNRFGGSAIGGAATADQLGLDLMAAIEAEDVLGVIDTMLPGERDSLGDPFVEMVSELQRLEVLAADTDLSSLAGLDIELEGERVAVDGTNVPDIVNVRLSADALVTLDGAALPIGALIEDQLPADALTELRNTRLAESEPFDLELTAVLEGDRWYFSLFHTLAEELRTDAGSPAIPATGIVPVGADTPEGAVNLLLDEVEQLDLAGLIGTLDPYEAQALQRYAPLFLGDAQAILDEAPLTWRVDIREFRAEGDGDERTVFVDALGIAGEVDGDEFTVRFDGDCVRAELGGEVIEQCTSTGEGVDEMFGETPALDDFITTMQDAFADMEPVGLELRQRDGLWYVSPLATGTDALLAGLRALDRSEIDLLVEQGEGAADEMFDVFSGGFGSSEPIFDPAIVDPATTDPTTLPPGTVPGQETAWERCYGEFEADAAAACFGDAVAAGELTEIDVPAVLRFPECGLADLLWSGGVYDLGDAEFVATLEPAVGCFEQLVDEGAIEAWELPFEVAYFDCFEGRNWFNVFDDDEYNARVDTCLTETTRFEE